MTKLCEFCDNPMSLARKYDNMAPNDETWEVYQCLECPIYVTFTFIEEKDKLIKTTFSIDLDNNLYGWTNNYPKGCSYVEKLSDVDPMMGYKPLIEFPHIMDITPTNAAKKLAFYLPFI